MTSECRKLSYDDSMVIPLYLENGDELVLCVGPSTSWAANARYVGRCANGDHVLERFGALHRWSDVDLRAEWRLAEKPCRVDLATVVEHLGIETHPPVPAGTTCGMRADSRHGFAHVFKVGPWWVRWPVGGGELVWGSSPS
jgi:hypothetical protein